jgi:imidazoleglycerol-phosphate dehydratase
LAWTSGLSVHLLKIRGNNGHHIVESAFKAFSRAFRNLLDGTDTTVDSSDERKLQTTDRLWGVHSHSFRESIAKTRIGISSRKTKETSIEVKLKLDGGADGILVHTGIQMLDSFFTQLSKEAWMSLQVTCSGDLWVDDHHSSEDVAIAVGKNLNEALGTKAGLNRMWCAEAHVGSALVEVVMDLSNRPCLTHNLSLSENTQGLEYAEDLSIEMFEHVLDSLVMNSQMTVHIVQKCDASCHVSDLILATGMAFGKALRYCIAVDPRRAGATASSKGTLSV